MPETATNQVKPEGGMQQAVTKVNVLSFVIYDVVEVDAVMFSGRRNEGWRNGKLALALPESETMACCKMGFMGTWEICRVLPGDKMGVR